MKEELREQLERFLDPRMIQAVFSGSNDRELADKVKVRPVLIKQELMFQAEEFRGKQAFHKNLSREAAVQYMETLLNGKFRQMELISEQGTLHVLVSKKGTTTIKVKREKPVMIAAGTGKIAADTGKITAGTGKIALDAEDVAADLERLSHNRQKRYILEEGRPVPFLEDLGVMTSEGQVVKAKYNKFKQINRFLEYIEDILPRLPKDREVTILDFGCGKSYLTFAMYYYLKELKGYPIRIIGLDLKQDVIDYCNQLSRRYGFETLQFYHGDIADYEGVSQVDMVVTLHACDTATDYALAKAVRWGASVILSVPCCQHELNKQIHNELLEPVLQYGLIKERMAALYTDALRAQLLENCGYRTQILEFIDMEHTPKNILIRAVYQGEKKDNREELEKLMGFLSVSPTLYKLL